jgi:transcriptional regulator with GAF, ATPase, and Fis domain
LLVAHFLERFNEGRRELGRPALEVSPEAMSGLMERPWNGNIRELKNVVERAASLGDGPVLTRRDFLLDGGQSGLVSLSSAFALPALSAPQTPAASDSTSATAQPAAPAIDRTSTVVFPVDIGVAFKDAKQTLGDDFEAIYLRKLVVAHKGNISQCAKAAGLTRRLVGFEMVGRAPARHDYPVVDAAGATIGRVTSGSFSPTLKKNIGLAYVPVGQDKLGSALNVQIRDRAEPAVVVKTPFVVR